MVFKSFELDSDFLPCFTIVLKGLETELLQEKLWYTDYWWLYSPWDLQTSTCFVPSRVWAGGTRKDQAVRMRAVRCDHGLGWCGFDLDAQKDSRKIMENLGPRCWFYFHPFHMGKWSNLTNYISFFFEVGWFNHQLETCDLSYQLPIWSPFLMSCCHLLQAVATSSHPSRASLRCVMWITCAETHESHESAQTILQVNWRNSDPYDTFCKRCHFKQSTTKRD